MQEIWPRLSGVAGAGDVVRWKSASAGGALSPNADRRPGGGPGPDGSWDVLLVEDDRVIREELADLLQHHGYAVTTAAHGREALDCIERGRVRLVILDLVLPIMSGWEFLSVVRSIPRLARLPVLVITAGVNADRVAGEPVFLKPLNVSSLLRGVDVYLGRGSLS